MWTTGIALVLRTNCRSIEHTTSQAPYETSHQSLYFLLAARSTGAIARQRFGSLSTGRRGLNSCNNKHIRIDVPHNDKSGPQTFTTCFSCPCKCARILLRASFCFSRVLRRKGALNRVRRQNLPKPEPRVTAKRQKPLFAVFKLEGVGKSVLDGHLKANSVTHDQFKMVVKKATKGEETRQIDGKQLSTIENVPSGVRPPLLTRVKEYFAMLHKCWTARRSTQQLGFPFRSMLER
jgi:hypothetical protein